MKLELQFAWLLAILAMMLAIASCSDSDTTRETQQRIPAYEGQSQVRSDSNAVSIGDSIAITVWDAPQFNSHSIVKSNGTITIPLLGEMMVAGYEKVELVRILRRRLSEYIKGDILFSVEVLSPPLKVSVFGMVGHQGSFPVNTQISLVEALIMAGGWGEAADLRYVRITHQSAFGFESLSVEFDLTPFLETGDMRGMPVVHPGDIVIVPRKENYILEFAGFVSSLFTLFGFFSLFK